MKFSHALILALIMLVLASLTGGVRAGYFALVLLYLVGAAIIPGVFVPVGVAVVLVMLLGGSKGGDKAAAWLSGLGKARG